MLISKYFSHQKDQHCLICARESVCLCTGLGVDGSLGAVDEVSARPETTVTRCGLSA